MRQLLNNTKLKRSIGIGLIATTVGLIYVKVQQTPTSDAVHGFTLAKQWDGPLSELSGDQEVFIWTHHQCHEPLVKWTASGDVSPLGAESLRQNNSTTWTIILRPDSRWSDDGSAVTANDYVTAWETRKRYVRSPEFDQITRVTATDHNTLSVELKSGINKEKSLRTLSSHWLSPLKGAAKNTRQDMELAGACDGPFVIKTLEAGRATFTRNHYWRGYNDSVLQSVALLRSSDLATSPESMLEKFYQGDISYVGQVKKSGLKDISKGASTKNYVENSVYYMIVNEQGAFKGPLAAFPHYAVNRGELAAVVTEPLSFSPMYQLTPLSFLDANGQSIAEKIPTTAVESILDARHLIGVKDNVKNDEIKFPLNRPIRLTAPANKRLKPILDRFVDRLQANYNVKVEILHYTENPPNITDADLAIVEMKLTSGAQKWATDVADLMKPYDPSQRQIITAYTNLAKALTTAALTPAMLTEVTSLCGVTCPVIALGQFGSSFLIDAMVIDAVVTGDPTYDPDVSKAKRLSVAKN